MKKSILFIFLTLASAFSSFSYATSIMPNSITLNFISIGAGIDFKADKAIKKIIARELTLGNVQKFETYDSVGFEGERSYCVVINKFDDFQHIFSVEKEMRKTLTRPGLTNISLGLGCGDDSFKDPMLQ